MKRFQSDRRLICYLGDTTEDILLRDRITVASKTLGISISKLLLESACYALDNVSDLRSRLT